MSPTLSMWLFSGVFPMLTWFVVFILIIWSQSSMVFGILLLQLKYGSRNNRTIQFMGSQLSTIEVGYCELDWELFGVFSLCKRCRGTCAFRSCSLVPSSK
ncbi:hypothetical protein LguiA_030558 [Lonicera macranthoides]